jgi:hypothetical protein
MKEILARGVNRLHDKKSLTGPPYPAQCKTRTEKIISNTVLVHWHSNFTHHNRRFKKTSNTAKTHSNIVKLNDTKIGSIS